MKPVTDPALLKQLATPEPAQTAAPAPKALRPVQDPETLKALAGGGEGDGIVANIGAGLNSAIANVGGAPVDAMTWLMNKAAQGVNYVAGDEVLGQIEDPFGGSGTIKRGLGLVGANPDDVTAATAGERIARSASEAAGSAALGVGLPGALAQTGVITQKAAQAAAPLVGDLSAGNMIANASAGAGGQIAAEIVPEEYQPLARVVGAIGGAMAPGAVDAAVQGAVKPGLQATKEFIRPMTEAGQKQVAGQRLVDAATDPNAVREAVEGGADELVKGSKPTLFQQTGDTGIGQLERGVRSKNPAPFLDRAAEQNVTRVNALKTIQAEGNPRTLADFVKGQWKAIDDQLSAAVKAADTNAAAARKSVSGVDKLPDDYGASMRSPVMAARDAAKAKETALWQAVDPDGALTINGSTVGQQAKNVLANVSKSAKPIAGEEAAIFSVAAQYGDNLPFREMTDLRSRVSTAMREELKTQGRSQTYARLTQLKSSIENAIDGAVENQAKNDIRAVASGVKSVEETAYGRLQQEVAKWNERRAAESMGQGLDASGRTTVTTGQGGVSSGLRSQNAGGRGFGNDAGDPRLQNLDGTPIDAEAAARLKAASQATKERASTFDSGPVGDITRKGETSTDFRLSDAQVPAKVFKSGATGGDAVKSYLAAGGDVATVNEYATQSLRKFAMGNDGVLRPERVRDWIDQHKPALSKLPPELSDKFMTVAKAEQAVVDAAQQQAIKTKEFQRSALAPFLKTDNPDDVTRTVAGIFGSRNAATEMDDLVKAIGTNAPAKQGLRKAVVEHINRKLMSNTEAGTSGVGQIKSDQLQTFIKQNKEALSKVFTPEEVASMDAVARDLQRSNRSIASSKIPNQSNTVQDIVASAKAPNSSSLLARIGREGGAAGVGMATGGWAVGLASFLGARVVEGMRAANLQTVDDLVEAALLNPDLARVLMKQAPGKVDLNTMAELARVLGNMTRAPGYGSMAGEE